MTTPNCGPRAYVSAEMDALIEALNRGDNTETLAADILRGARAIGEYTGLPTRQVFYLVEKNELPVFRLGKIICARKSELRRELSAEGGRDTETRK